MLLAMFGFWRKKVLNLAIRISKMSTRLVSPFETFTNPKPPKTAERVSKNQQFCFQIQWSMLGSQFSAKKLTFFDAMINILHNLALFRVKNDNFCSTIFSAKIFSKIITSVAG
jgi:hypothetical protein